MASAVEITLSEEERVELERRAAKLTLAYRDVQRAKVVLYAADGLSNAEIAGRLEMCSKVSLKTSCWSTLRSTLVLRTCSGLFRRLAAHRVGWSCPGFSIPSGAVRRPDESGSLPGQDRRHPVGGCA